MGMYGSRAVTLLVLISDDVINRILKLDIQTNILVYVTRCWTDLTSKVLKERTFGQSSAVLYVQLVHWTLVSECCGLKKVSEYDQKIPQSQTAYNPMAPRGRAVQPSRDTRKTN